MSFELRLNDISQAFSIPQNKQQQLFCAFSATVHAGMRVACTGASGQGKSSLLKIIARLEPPASGELILNNQTALAIEVTAWRKMIHYVAQSAVMYPGTVEQNLMLPSLLHGRTFQKGYAEQLLEQVGLSSFSLESDASSLSGGEKQRLALIRSLLLEPKILLLDEATASLDANNSLLVEELLNHWVKAGDHAYVWITHDKEQARRVADENWHFSNHHIHRIMMEGSI